MLSIQHHCIVTVGNIAYYLRNRVEGVIQSLPLVHGIVPAIVLHLDDIRVDLKTIQNAFARFKSADDVFSDSFVSGSTIYAQIPAEIPGKSPSVADDISDFLREKSSQVVLSNASKNDPRLPEGPYFLKDGEFHEAWRLYEDTLFSFVTTIVPAEKGDRYDYQPLQAGAYSGMYAVVAVPSRLYNMPTTDRPLNGMRISVKDNYHVSGIVTTIGSRSFAELYGAVIVGKSKMSGYASSEVPPEKCIDYFPPWNPRGDRYQGPSGSSSGAGSSAAGYAWLDLAVGTDTSGSIRMPAASYGLWGMKATQESFPLKGLVPSVPRFDAIGLLARESSRILDLYRATNFWQYHGRKPSRLIYPTDFYPLPNEQQQIMHDEFAHALEESLGFKYTPLSLSDLWEETKPKFAGRKTLSEYMEKSGEYINFYDGYHIFDDYRVQYQERFGRKPYTSPWVTSRWQFGIVITKEQREQAVVECDTVARWLAEHVLLFDDSDSGGTILLMPFGRPLANYRDTPGPPKDFPDTSYSPLYLASTLGLPQAVIPIGQNSFLSRVTDNTEYAPITGSLVGPRGTDVMLLEVAHAALVKAGWPTKVHTGRMVFALGDNSRNSAIGDVTDEEAFPSLAPQTS